MRLFKLLCAGVTTTLFSACIVLEIDAPPLSLGDDWMKDGYTKDQIKSALRQCGSDQIKSFDDIAKMDFCMLRQGFVYIDSPYRFAHKRCNRPADLEVWNSPSCRSLRGELIITPDEFDSRSPREANESIHPKTNATPIPIAPSASPAQRLQEKTQKDSNTQMNQMLQGSGNRK